MGVLQVALDRVVTASHLHDGALLTLHFPDGRRELQAAYSLGEAVVVGEHDDLSRCRNVGQHACQAVDLRRVHRLHRVVDEDEPERALLDGRARKEQRQPERVQLALAHHPERGAAVGAVDADVHRDSAAGLRAVQPYRAEVDVALLPQELPDPL